MKNELEASVRKQVYYAGIYLENFGKPRQTFVRPACVPDDNRIEDLPNTSLNRYLYTKLFGLAITFF